jgi:deoxyribose-phosphate aldolase
MKWDKKTVAATIDHAVLKANQTDADVKAACVIGKKYGVASICVRPTDVSLTARELKGSKVMTSTVIGFPFGHHRPEVKALEARLAIEDGAEELDMVMNIGRFLSGDFDHVEKDIAAVVAEAKPKRVPVKVILEVCYLTPEQIAKACLIAERAGAQFVKTSTGYGTGNATGEAVALMLKTVGRSMKVKASGGIRTWDAAVGFLDQGANRLGLSATEAVVDGAPLPGGTGDY